MSGKLKLRTTYSLPLFQQSPLLITLSANYHHAENEWTRLRRKICTPLCEALTNSDWRQLSSSSDMGLMCNENAKSSVRYHWKKEVYLTLLLALTSAPYLKWNPVVSKILFWTDPWSGVSHSVGSGWDSMTSNESYLMNSLISNIVSCWGYHYMLLMSL